MCNEGHHPFYISVFYHVWCSKIFFSGKLTSFMMAFYLIQIFCSKTKILKVPCVSMIVLDTAAGVWCDSKSVVTTPRTGRYSADAAGGDAAVELTRRCRHAAAAVGDLIFIYGGLRGGKMRT